MATPPIHIFSKPDCVHCDSAKHVLREAGLDYVEHDIAASKVAADASVYFSGVGTVPQIFIGDYSIKGAADLKGVSDAGHLKAILDFSQGRSFPFADTDPGLLATGAQDVLFRDYIEQLDPTKSTDPEIWSVLHFFKMLFGFLPNTFTYLGYWPEAFKLWVFTHNFPCIGIFKDVLGDPLMYTIGYSAANAHGCTYCQTHISALGGDESVTVVKDLRLAREGRMREGTTVGPYELALADLAAHASLNDVKPEHIEAVYATVDQALHGPRNVEADFEATVIIAAVFGFLNIINDLTGVEAEGGLSKTAVSELGLDPGRHGASEADPDNLDYDLPEDCPAIEEMLMMYEAAIEDQDAYTKREFGIFPGWMKQWPELLRNLHMYFYGELMGDRGHSMLSSEFKHLLGRVSAIAKGHDALAATEGFMAYHASADGVKATTLERIRHCYDAAVGRLDKPGLFSEAEKAALAIAWLSAQVPLITPRRFVEEANGHYDSKGLIEIMTVCAVTSLVQRFCAVRALEIDPQVAAFLREHNLTYDSLLLRNSVS